MSWSSRQARYMDTESWPNAVPTKKTMCQHLAMVLMWMAVGGITLILFTDFEDWESFRRFGQTTEIHKK